MLPGEEILKHRSASVLDGKWRSCGTWFPKREGVTSTEPGAGLCPWDFVLVPQLLLLRMWFVSPAQVLMEIFHMEFRRH